MCCTWLNSTNLFIVLWLRSCGLWYFFCLVFLGRCQNRCRRCLRAGMSVSEEEAMGGYGRQFHYVSCVVFGEWNDWCFEGHDLNAAKLKYLLLKSLFDWILQSVFFLSRGSCISWIPWVSTSSICLLFFILLSFVFMLYYHYTSHVLGQNLYIFLQ